LDPLDAIDADLDRDGDGMSNLDEYLKGRHPLIDERRLLLILQFSGY